LETKAYILSFNQNEGGAKLMFILELKNWKKLSVLIGFLIIFTSYGCSSTKGVSMMDSFNNSPIASELMNEATSKAVDQLNVQPIENKAVKLVVRAPGFNNAQSAAMNPFGCAATKFNPNYMQSLLERKLSEVNGRVVQETDDADAQVCMNVNSTGCQKRTFQIPLIILPLSVFHTKEYWAVFDGTADIKTGDGSRILKTQNINSKSKSHNEFGILKFGYPFMDDMF